MNICPFCERNNLEGALVCAHCGRSSSIFSNLPTRVIPEETNPTRPRWQGRSPFTEKTVAVLHVDDVREPLLLPIQQATVLGRANAASGQYPDVDLTPQGAFAKGVSARHAMLQRDGDNLMLSDLNSTNGTFLNSKRLPPHLAVIVHDGAEIRLGKLVIKLYFENTAGAPITKTQPIPDLLAEERTLLKRPLS